MPVFSQDCYAAMLLSYSILGEKITAILIAGALFILYGIYLTEKG